QEQRGTAAGDTESEEQEAGRYDPRNEERAVGCGVLLRRDEGDRDHRERRNQEGRCRCEDRVGPRARARTEPSERDREHERDPGDDAALYGRRRIERVREESEDAPPRTVRELDERTGGPGGDNDGERVREDLDRGRRGIVGRPALRVGPSIR